MDGSCRHVVATLFEIMDFRNDQNVASVTSGPNQWIRRGTESYDAALITDLETSLHGDTNE